MAAGASAWLRRTWSHLPANARGALWVTFGTVFFALGDTFVKFVGESIHPVQMALFRYVTGFVLLSPWFLRAGREAVRTQHLKLHLLRALIAGSGQAAVYYAVIHLLLADATAIAFSRPLFLTLLAVFILGETVGWRRWTATTVGFAGVLVMVRPGSEAFNSASVVAVAAALVFSLGLILIRYLSRTEPPIRILFYYHVFGIAMFVAPSIALWQTPSAQEWPLLFMIGLCTTIGMATFVRGFSVGEASIVGPMEYTRLIYAALIGFYVFAEIPNTWTYAGAAIIVAATIYIARREAFGGGPPAG